MAIFVTFIVTDKSFLNTESWSGVEAQGKSSIFMVLSHEKSSSINEMIAANPECTREYR